MYIHIKYLLARMIGLLGLLILWPLFVIIAIAIKLDSPGPVFFRQERLGLHGQVYRMYKFRSMVVDAEHTGSGVYSGKGDPRVTKVGRILRATSLDEIPQLINLLLGDMTVVSYRSPLTYHPWPLEQYTPEQRHMFDIKPGITGWAQVHGRKCVEWNKRIEMNCWYVDHVSLLLDIRILFMTVAAVLTNKNNENIGETVKKDNGSEV